METSTLSLPKVRTPSGLVQATGVKLRKGSALVVPASMWRKVSGVWTLLWTALSINLGASVSNPGGTIRHTLVNITPTITPPSAVSSWAWTILSDQAGLLTEVSTSVSSATYNGPDYNNSGIKLQSNATVRYNVVVGGQPYFKDVVFSYTYGDL